MSAWFETIGVILVALFGIFLGRVFSSFRKPYWILGYFLPSVLIAILVLARYYNAISFVPPVCWLIAGRTKFVVLAFAVTMGVTTPLSRLPYRCEKIILCTLMAMVVIWFSVLPFAVPALIRNHLSNLETMVDSNGVCFQSTDYTCGPAAAVTALGKLGLPADEGEIAILSHSSPVAGTLIRCLYTALQDRYGPYGLKCQYRHFDSVGQLRDAGVTLAVIKNAFMSDHCIAVLDVSERMVTVADPVVGRMLMSREQFEKIWRFSGIVLKREPEQSIQHAPGLLTADFDQH